MAEYATGNQLRAISDMVRAERMITEVTDRELQAWTKKFLSKLQEQSLPGVAPDLAQLEFMREEWESNHIPEILAVALLAWRKRYKRKRKSMNIEAEQRFSDQVTQTLRFIPDRAFALSEEAIEAGIRSGFTLDALVSDLNERVLAYVTVTSDRTGRLLGPSAVNDATISSFLDSQILDGTGPYVKSWVSVMDSEVRPTHVLANADPENQRIPIESKFLVGGFLADHPRDFDLPLWESAGCRCIADVTHA